MINTRVDEHFLYLLVVLGLRLQVQSSDGKGAANDEDMMQWLNEIEGSDRGASFNAPMVGPHLLFTHARLRSFIDVITEVREMPCTRLRVIGHAQVDRVQVKRFGPTKRRAGRKRPDAASEVLLIDLFSE